MTNVNETVAAVINKLSEAAANNTQNAIDLGLASIKFDAICDFIIAFVCILVSLACVYFIRKIYKSEYREDDWATPTLIILGVIAIFSILGTLSVLLNGWEYVALFNPKLFLAHQIIGSIGS